MHYRKRLSFCAKRRRSEVEESTHNRFCAVVFWREDPSATLRMTEEGRDIGGHRWSPPPPLLLPLPLGEVPARSKGEEGTSPLSHAGRVTALPEGEPRPHPSRHHRKMVVGEAFRLPRDRKPVPYY